MISIPKALLAGLCATLSFAIVGSTFFVPNFRGYDGTQFPIAQPDPLIVPATYAFIIWAPIYLWLIIGMTWGLFKRRENDDWTRFRVPLVISMAVGTFWLPVAAVNPLAATVMIVVMLAGALGAFLLSPRSDSRFASLPIGLYAGWLSAAACVSVGVAVTGYGLLPDLTSTIVLVITAIAIGFTVQWRIGRVPTYGLAVIWALVALAVDVWGRADIVAYVALAGALAITVPTIRAFRSGLGKEVSVQSAS